MKLIDKDAVLAIIEKELSYYKDLEDRKIISDCGIAVYRVVRMLKSDIESLEVKEVDNVLYEVDNVNPKECMYSKGNYTDEDRKVLCDGCEEECKFNKKEPVSEDLEEAVNAYIGYTPEVDESSSTYGKRQAFKAGANWQKENLWKPADGNDLPEIDREVIALLDDGKVVFAHRPPEYWDGKNIVTGKVTRNYPKTYDKGGWNIPDIVYWLDVELPKEIEL